MYRRYDCGKCHTHATRINLYVFNLLCDILILYYFSRIYEKNNMNNVVERAFWMVAVSIRLGNAVLQYMLELGAFSKIGEYHIYLCIIQTRKSEK